ncbi:MAG: hypothetical protein R3C11_14750 [Planctomycetaceae bacterium]
MKKEYRALTWNELDFDSDYVETHMRQSFRNRERMIVCEEGEMTRFMKTFLKCLSDLMASPM